MYHLMVILSVVLVVDFSDTGRSLFISAADERADTPEKKLFSDTVPGVDSGDVCVIKYRIFRRECTF